MFELMKPVYGDDLMNHQITESFDHRRFYQNCVNSSKSAQIFIEVHGIGIEHLENINLSHSDQLSGLPKSACTVYSVQVY